MKMIKKFNYTHESEHDDKRRSREAREKSINRRQVKSFQHELEAQMMANLMGQKKENHHG